MAGVMLQVWKLHELHPDRSLIPAVAVRLMRLSGARVWAFKVVDGGGLYSEFANDQRLYTDTAAALHKAGYEIAAWGYHYGRKWLGFVGPEREARAVLRAREILAFDTYFVDAEAEWERTARAGDATKLVRPLKEAGLSVWLESFRYPTLHPIRWHEWARVLNGGWAPQVYWEQATNAAAQVERSHREHMAIADLPFWPVFPAYCRNDPYWCPTAKQFYAAVAKAHDLGAVGVGAWKAEWLSAGWPLRRPFVDALKTWPDTPPDPDPPDQDPCDVGEALNLAYDLKRQADALLTEVQTLAKDAKALLSALQAMQK